MGNNKTVEFRRGWFLVYHPSAFRLAYFAQQNDPDQVMEFDGFIAHCQPGNVLFDIGAHFGLFSLAALHYGGSTAKAVAVDPSPAACRMIKIQADLNGVAHRLEVVQACASSQVGWNQMVDSGIQSASYFVQPSRDHAGKELTRTPCVTLDSLADNLKARPTHVKIDVEGFEEEVLRGGTNVLSQSEGPLLFIELHNQMVSERGGNPKRALVLLEELGYNKFAPDGSRLVDWQILSKPLIRIMAKKMK